MTHIRLTDTKVKDLVAKGLGPDDKPRIYRDDKVRGLFVEVNQLSASYKVQSTLRKHGGKPKSIRKTLGRTTDYTLDQARKWADDVLGTIRKGEVPIVKGAGVPTLEQAYDDYAKMRDRQGKDTTHTSNIKLNSRTHLGDWLSFPVDKISRAMVVERHTKIGVARGPFAANHTIKQLRAVLNSVDGLPNPVTKITWFKPREELDEHGQPVSKAIPLELLPSWWAAVAGLTNPVRRNLHQLALLSGMRYGHLVETRRAWVDVAARCIRFPKLKRGRPFTLPLSAPMAAIAAEAMKLEAKDNPFLFWAESKSGHIEDWREHDTEWRAWPGDTAEDDREPLPTGHCLRHTFVSIANKTRIPQHHREMLVDHAVRGMHGHYTDASLAFPELLEAQSEISALILDAAGVKLASIN